jgi:hypothetical protein
VIDGTTHDKEVSFPFRDHLILDLPNQLSGSHADELEVLVPIHAKRLPPAQGMMYDIHREIGVERPDVNPLSIDLTIDHEELLAAGDVSRSFHFSSRMRRAKRISSLEL